jgi:flagellar capping protein FliD
MTVSTTTQTAPNSFGVSSTGSSTAVSGLGSGIDTTAIINALMAVNGQTETNLKAQQTANNTKISDYQTLNTKMLALQTAARSLGSSADWQQLVATSSNSTAATATTSGGGSAGSVTFSVLNLATANVDRPVGQLDLQRRRVRPHLRRLQWTRPRPSYGRR